MQRNQGLDLDVVDRDAFGVQPLRRFFDDAPGRPPADQGRLGVHWALENRDGQVLEDCRQLRARLRVIFMRRIGSV